MGKIARLDEMLKGYESDKRERIAIALYWVDQWGLDVTESQTGGRVKWWLTQVEDEDRDREREYGEDFVEHGRNHYRLLADVAMQMAK